MQRTEGEQFQFTETLQPQQMAQARAQHHPHIRIFTLVRHIVLHKTELDETVCSQYRDLQPATMRCS